MVLHKGIQVLIKRYSFIKNVEMKGIFIYLYYEKNNKLKYKRLPYRATKHMLIKTINEIKKDIDYKSYEKAIKTYVNNELKKKPIIGVNNE